MPAKRPRCVATRVGEGAVGGGGEVEGAAGGVLQLEVAEQRLVVGEVGDVERDGGGDVALEGGLAPGEPAGDGEERAGVLAGEREDGIDEGVGFDEGAVEVDAEGQAGGELGVGERLGWPGGESSVTRQRSLIWELGQAGARAATCPKSYTALNSRGTRAEEFRNLR